MANVVCLGVSVLDIVFDLAGLPDTPVKYYARSRGEMAGGIAVNGARAICRLGGSAVLGSRIGEDLAGRSVLAEIEGEGIDLSGVHVVPGGRTSLSAVLLDPRGERMLVNDTDIRTITGTEGVPLAAIDRADGILADTRWSDGCALALARAKPRGIPTVLDFDASPEPLGLPPLLEGASHIIFGTQGLEELTGTGDPAQGLALARARSPAWLAVTRSDEGVFWLEDDELRHMPAFAVRAVDTLGAGDIFHAAFALAMAEGQSEIVALRFASATAAIKCTRPGGGLGAPRRAEVEAFLERQERPGRS
jgi:sulfofructose kinase